MSTDATIQKANEYLKSLVQARLQAMSGLPTDKVEPFDVEKALEESNGTAAELTASIAHMDPWEKTTGILKNHEVIRSVVNSYAMKDALLDRRRKFLAGINRSVNLRRDGESIDIAVRSHSVK